MKLVGAEPKSALELEPEILYDLTGNGRPDLVKTIWHGKPIILVSDDGRFPWPKMGEKRNWDNFLSKAFHFGEGRPQTWNEARGGWGSYTILVDRDLDGTFDGPNDVYYKPIDVDGDGRPEAEFIVLNINAGSGLRLKRLFFCLNGSHVMNYLDWEQFAFTAEQTYTGHSRYIQGVHGNGLFLSGLLSWGEMRMGWENPIAFYDFDDDGYTNMVIRATGQRAQAGRQGDHRPESGFSTAASAQIFSRINLHPVSLVLFTAPVSLSAWCVRAHDSQTCYVFEYCR